MCVEGKGINKDRGEGCANLSDSPLVPSDIKRVCKPKGWPPYEKLSEETGTNKLANCHVASGHSSSKLFNVALLHATNDYGELHFGPSTRSLRPSF